MEKNLIEKIKAFGRSCGDANFTKRLKLFMWNKGQSPYAVWLGK